MGASLTVIAIVIIYLGIMLMIGYISSKKINDNEDFLVAGRKMGPWLLAGSLAAVPLWALLKKLMEIGGFRPYGMSSRWRLRSSFLLSWRRCCAKRR